MLEILQNGSEIHGDTKPFTKAESRFADAKFYMDKDIVPEAFPTKIKPTSKAVPRLEKLPTVSSLKKSGDKILERSTSKESGVSSKGSNILVF
ncbi:hypothetical protein ACFX2K_043552 [Malus domestica]